MASLTEKFCEQTGINKDDIGHPALDSQIQTITSTLVEISDASARAEQGATSLGNSTIDKAAKFLQQPMPEVDLGNDLSADMDNQNTASTTPKPGMGPGY